MRFAKACHAAAIDERKCVNISAHNSPEYAISYIGGIFNNCYCSGVYPTNGAEACFYQADNS